jgi:hypothetical protein
MLPTSAGYGSLGPVRNRLLQRLFVMLGMVAMLGALLAVPMTASYALGMAGKTTATASKMSMPAAADEMPCHKPKKHCPNCPQKVCPEMGSCLIKCFQTLPQPVAEAWLQRDIIDQRVMPAATRVTPGSQIPPLLRPPSV